VPPYAPGGQLDRAWGLSGNRKATGGRRYYFIPLASSDYLAVNASRPLFRDVRMRRALAYELNRQSLAELFQEAPSDQLLTPALPAFHDRDLYPLDSPDPSRAKQLARPAVKEARTVVRSDCSQCSELDDQVRTALATLGVRLQVDERPDGRPTDRGPGSAYDIFNGYTQVEYPDGPSLLRTMVGDTVPVHWFPRGIPMRVAAVDRLTGLRRDAAAAALADDLVRHATVIPFATFGPAQFLSPRLERSSRRSATASTSRPCVAASASRDTSAAQSQEAEQMEQTEDLAAVFDAHVAAEFADRDLDAAMATMAEDPYVYHVPVMTGGVGTEQVRRFYGSHFIGKWPSDLEITPVSRTVGDDQVVDELVISFTHDLEMDAILPGVPPTGKRVRLPFCVVVGFDGGKVAHEHIYWDQASLLAQVGLLDRAQLPVTGAEQVENLLDRGARPVNELISEGWAL
jgi:carboxymethylenebutenolidase